jgi:hypothetical protein
LRNRETSDSRHFLCRCQVLIEFRKMSGVYKESTSKNLSILTHPRHTTHFDHSAWCLKVSFDFPSKRFVVPAKFPRLRYRRKKKSKC